MPVTFTHLMGPRKGRQEKFDSSRITIGRATDNALRFGDEARRVSSHHAEIIRRGDGYILRDLGSTNGTMINGRRVIVSELNNDDLIEFGAGGPLVRFAIESGEEATERAAVKEQLPASNASIGSAKSSSNAVVTRSARSRRANAALIAAVVAAMLLGAFGGIVLSSRLRSNENQLKSFSEIAELNSPAVVFIRVEYELIGNDGRAIAMTPRTGSGFVISSSGLVVTNRHLVRDWEYRAATANATGRTTKIEVIFPHQSRAAAVQAQIEKLSASRDTDVAILKINPDAIPVVHGVEANLNQVNQGDEVAVIGYPLGFELLDLTNDERVAPSLSTGVVSRIGQDFIQLQLRAYQGTSGGPVLNRKGEVIAIITANVGNAQEITLATPIAAAMNLVRDN
ncbi:MAG TPA: trypsin-like peptidase domain-containing protein [Blastocatellia bacterium]|nr:trypsin-like peptidase domain-containing protein [Blastocatellia bacterium]